MARDIESWVDQWGSQFYQPVPKGLKVGRTEKKKEKERTCSINRFAEVKARQAKEKTGEN